MVAAAVEDERFLILTDELAQKWMEGKTGDLERWLRGMRRLNDKIESMGRAGRAVELRMTPEVDFYASFRSALRPSTGSG